MYVDDGVLYDVRDEDIKSGIFEFPEEVIEIGGNAFNHCPGLKKTTIPGHIKKIGNYAFEGSNLEELNLQEGIEIIGKSAFRDCSCLQNIVLPNSITKIMPHAFRNCTKLDHINIPQNVFVGERAFFLCEKLRYVKIQEGVFLSSNTFNGCKALKEVWMKQNVKTFDNSPFRNCKSLKCIHWGNRDIEVMFLDDWCVDGECIEVKERKNIFGKEIIKYSLLFKDEAYWISPGNSLPNDTSWGVIMEVFGEEGPFS